MDIVIWTVVWFAVIGWGIKFLEWAWGHRHRSQVERRQIIEARRRHPSYQGKDKEVWRHGR